MGELELATMLGLQLEDEVNFMLNFDYQLKIERETK